MCEYCEKNKPIFDDYEKKVEIVANTLYMRQRTGNVFNAIVFTNTLRINYCPMCREKTNTRKMF